MQKSFLPPLSTTEEKYYLEQLSRGDIQARDVLIERNMRLVAYIAKKYLGTEENMEDLISIGTIGLIKAVSTFRPDRAKRLGTYAARCIENELLMYFRYKKKSSREVSLNEPIGTDREGNQITLAEVVESPEAELWERVLLKKNIGQLYALLPHVLNRREQYIICKRYGLYNMKPGTQREIAAALGISRFYVSRIEKKALCKLKRAFSQQS
ncbi:MAG: RNA polymerase sporulation sigma factor SigK [Clostridiales bacterium]|nr:RNA polymerase sporulation sigma factor SigK [Clostridiales bacterium]